jgi:hypothetical protein
MIFGKYIFPLSIARWLRLPDICTQNASLTCLSITKNIKYIHQWICWKPGSGFEIYIGRDAILGLGLVTYLSRDLLEQLNLSNIFFLFQGQSPTDDRLTCTIWKSSVDLELSGTSDWEWTTFCSALCGAGIHLQAADDIFLWNGGDCSGFFTVRNIYKAITSTIWTHRYTG